jgi:SAM-dependent methyltransferase
MQDIDRGRSLDQRVYAFESRQGNAARAPRFERRVPFKTWVPPTPGSRRRLGEMKPGHLRLLGRFGLLVPAFRVKERMQSLGVKGGGVGPEGLSLPPPKLLFRVAGTTDTTWFVEGGRLAEESIRAALARAGAPLESLGAILDFGCGCGRVLRRWYSLDARICGTDLSKSAMKWCRSHLPFVEVDVNRLEPPLAYGDASFDLVYALSVLTHLPIKTQLAWRDELGRVLRPGGHLLLTVHGEAYFEQLTDEERPIYVEGGCVVRWGEAAGSNFCMTIHSPEFVRDRLADGWEFVEHVRRGALGNPEQDLILLRKPDPERVPSRHEALHDASPL